MQAFGGCSKTPVKAGYLRGAAAAGLEAQLLTPWPARLGGLDIEPSSMPAARWQLDGRGSICARSPVLRTVSNVEAGARSAAT